MMTYKSLQTALKTFKAEGRTSIKLNATKVALQAEYDRLTAVTEAVTEAAHETAHGVTPEVAPEVAPETAHEVTHEVAPETAHEVTFHSFKEILRQRKPLYTFRKAHGFKIVKPEKRYDQLTIDEWREDTLAFLDDYIIYDECDYMAA
jgi:hypothetical protein